ncbi:MAG: molybdate ABC transporter substrate-binding protein [Chloroflexota bacterium]
MKNKPIFLISLLIFFALASCSDPTAASTTTVMLPEPVDLNVFAAASLTEAFTEIGRAFEAERPEVKVIFNFAGSQQLVQQMAEGAPADVFASANQKQMDAAIQTGRIDGDAAQVFARNQLLLVYPADNPAGLGRLEDLAKPGVKLVLADENVPVGQYARDFLDKTAQDAAFGSDYAARVLGNVVSYENNVKSVLGKVVLGEADAGIVYTSDVIGEDATKVGRIEIPDALNVPAVYPLAALNDSQQVEAAQAFVAMVLSETGQAILAAYGLIPAVEE